MARHPVPEPEPPETDPELEKTIADLIERPEGSAARRLAVRELAGLRYSREEAGVIIESLDPHWGDECVPNPGVDPGTPTGMVLPLQRRQRRK